MHRGVTLVIYECKCVYVVCPVGFALPDNRLVAAANAYKKVQIPKAVECLESATNIYLQTGKLQQAAKLYADIGDMRESSGSEEMALEAFQKAADLYSSEESQSQANKVV